ncbi:MAG: SMI1/KNR4 family protein [Eubacteriales bacterium]|nr:SMI1/KNR4 family protein [Eubacteriales bacterium]
MYRELIAELIRGNRWARLQEPCPEEELDAAEAYVGFAFPEELKALLRETNGDRDLLMSARQIIETVQNMREIFPEAMEPDEFEEKINRHVFFAGNGCGDYYCYRVLPNGETDDSAVYIWEHELFETRRAADNIAELIVRHYRDEL